MVENMFFYPDRVTYTRPEQFGLRVEELHFASAGAQLHGWWLPAVGAATGSVLHVHGNAANISNHLPLVAWLPLAGFNVLMFDYRGFGQSEGRPTLNGIVDDAAAALAVLRQRPDVDAARLAIFGQSLGGATALRLLARPGAAQGVRLAIIDSAFSSYRSHRARGGNEQRGAGAVPAAGTAHAARRRGRPDHGTGRHHGAAAVPARRGRHRRARAPQRPAACRRT
jgi:uncharacterized protein